MIHQQKQLISKEYVHSFNQRVKHYFPQGKWTPVDDALFAPDDLYNIPLEDAQHMQLAAIQFTFAHHYQNNKFYRKLCEKQKVSPEDIQSDNDLIRIPLIPDTFFKNYPSGKEFATWLGNIFTGELPNIVIEQKHPSYDQVIDAFNAAGLFVNYSSGTGGCHTFIPRDYRTFCNMQYSLAKSTLAMTSGDYVYESEVFLLAPDPRINSIFVGKASQILFDTIQSVRIASDRKLTVSQISMMMGNGMQGRIARYASTRQTKKLIDAVIDWLIVREASQKPTALSGTPYLIHSILQRIKNTGKSFNFQDRAGVSTGGGWKIHENERLSASDFRAEVREVLGIPERHCIDLYGMVESNGWMVQCPEGHYFHAPYSYFKPMVLADNMQLAKPGESGRFAFLDASALSYPGFILTGDQVKLLEKCPACDRPGPVLDPEIRRAAGEGDRGCAGEIMRIFSISKATL